MKTNSFISEYLGKLGFTHEEILLYTSLIQHGSSTLLQASRNTGIERTKLYRLIEDLAKRGIVEEIPSSGRRTIKAADLSTIELLVKEKERIDTYLASSYADFANEIKSFQHQLPGNNVIYYHGKEGMRQMTWHILRTKSLFRTYSYCFWNDILGDNFALKLNMELLANHIKVHDLYSDEYIEFKKKWLTSGKKKPEGDWSFWDSRYISEKIAKIHLNIDVYNDVVAYYYWQNEEIFGVEIYNERVAALQKQMHDVLWKMAEKRPDIQWTSHGLD